MDTSNASEPPPGDELSGECAVVLKADVQKSMEENVSTSIAGSSGSENRKPANKFIAEMDIPNNDPTQVAIPERQKGDINPDAVKMYKLTFHEVIWPALVHVYGWRLDAGSRPNDCYFLPKGVERGKKGYKNRLDFFDSSKQVIEKLLGEEYIYQDTLDDAWRASHVKKAKKIVADRDKKKISVRASRRRKASLSGWAHFTSLKHTRMGDQFQVDPSMIPKWFSASSVYPPREKILSTEAPQKDDVDLLYAAVWQPSTEDNQEELSAYLKDGADKLSEDQLLIAFEASGRDLQKASVTVAKFAATHGKTGVDGILLEPWGDDEALKYSNLMVMHLKHFGKVASSMPNRTLGEVMHRYYACWKKHNPFPTSKEGDIVEEQTGEQMQKVAGDNTANATALTKEIESEAGVDNTVCDELAKEEGKAEGDKVKQRLQFDDATTAVQQPKSEVKEEDANTIPPTVTEEKKSSQSNILPPSTLNQEVGSFKEEESNIHVGASRGTYHPLNPPSLPYSTRRFLIVPDEEFLEHKAAHTKVTATEESAAAVAATPEKQRPTSVSPSTGDEANTIPPVLFFVKESEARCYTEQYLELKIAVREDRIVKEQAEIQNIQNDDFCYKCQIDSVLDLLCCDGCPRTYHLTCVDLKEVPKGDWMCDICLGLRDPDDEPIGVRKRGVCIPNCQDPVGLVEQTPAVPTRRGPNRSARRNSAYSEEPDGGLLLELALNPHLQQLPSESPVSVRDRRPMISPMSSEDETVAGKGKAASIPAVVC